MLSLALGLVVGLIFGYIGGASGSPRTGYNAIDSGSDHFVYQYSTENETHLDIVPRPPLEGYTSCRMNDAYSTAEDSTRDVFNIYRCYNHPNKTHPDLKTNN